MFVASSCWVHAEARSDLARYARRFVVVVANLSLALPCLVGIGWRYRLARGCEACQKRGRGPPAGGGRH